MTDGGEFSCLGFIPHPRRSKKRKNMKKSMTFEEYINSPLDRINFKSEEYRAENVVAHHTDEDKKYEDPALALADYQVFKRNYELRAEFANRYSNCRANITDEAKTDVFGRNYKVLTYTEVWDKVLKVKEIITLK